MKITFRNGALVVPQNPTIPYIQGDGIGSDIWPATQRVIDWAVDKSYRGERKIEWMEVLAGGKSFDKSGEWLPESTLQAFKDYMVGIKGPLTTPVGGGMRSLNVALRQELDLYVCLRPTQYFRGIVSPLREPQRVDMTIFRENTEDIYAGIEWKEGTVEARKFLDFLQNEMGVKKVRFPDSSAFGVKPISREGSERLVRAAIKFAVENRKPSLTLVHKGNIMKFTEGGFKTWGYEVCEREFGDSIFSWREWEKLRAEKGEDQANLIKDRELAKGKVLVNDCIADAFLQNTLLYPTNYSVIATTNLNGDYMSDQLAAMVGGIGIAPGANINYLTGHAIFEATHGTAPMLEGKNVANPCSLLLSGVMMLEYLGWDEAALTIVQALQSALDDGCATSDLASVMPSGRVLSTSEFTELLIDKIY